MKRGLPIFMILLTLVFIAVASVRPGKKTPTTPDGAVQAMFQAVKAKDWDGAFALLASADKTEKRAFIGDLAGRDASLRTYSSLERVDTSVLTSNDREALVRASLHYSSAVGALEDTRDLKVVKEGADWKVVWPVEKPSKVPPQVIPVNYLRWDVITRGVDDDWGAQNVNPPKVRIISMNATERDGSTIILGEIVNEDTVPGFVAVTATLISKDGSVLGEETSFDKISHTLLPKEVSPFRIDFPGIKLANVKSVRMQPNSMLVPASADPVIAVVHQRIETDARGKHVLKGELINQSGQTVNIPHVLATFYDNAGKVIWVSDGYDDQALLPQTPEPFAVSIAKDLANKVHSYRVTVNEYSINRGDM
ncbi:MAG: hypothetical protein ACE14M_08900 [Terriglobales bacterium]